MVEAAAQEQSCRGEIKLLRERIAASARTDPMPMARRKRIARRRSNPTIEALENAQSDNNDHSSQRRDAELAALGKVITTRSKKRWSTGSGAEHAKAQGHRAAQSHV